MNTLRHPDDSTLISYCAGALSQGISLVTTAHLERCPVCRTRLRQAEQIGGVLMQKHSSTVVPLHGRAAMLSRLDEPAPQQNPAINPQLASNQDPDLMPACLQTHFGQYLSGLKWKTLLPGVQRVQAQGIEQGNLMLLKIAPGVSMPMHSHSGSEITMVLKGSYYDELGDFKPGDVADLDSDVQHQPIAYGECICLLATDSPLRFHGWLARMMQPFFKI
ncbi:transcriptional regulator [Pseudomonas viridiflava]|uniref:Transcriptional activator ChrR n=1 Tax=Pseudomonas viridiflava TaxID=33069 RepID=A0A3M5P931_PSEVI|nr:ChrR family anti-sigma-E factor [Pseudomonas viridiflava]MBA1231982.1 transcriptional regulator [Pseudomonas viridiflava]RMT81240.1 Transcriptional activator ChrR [Pseudomonas viridiflava]